jgi:hypothetical protein
MKDADWGCELGAVLGLASRELIGPGSHDLPGPRPHEVLARDCRKTLDEPGGLDVALLLNLLRETRVCLLQVFFGHTEPLLS